MPLHYVDRNGINFWDLSACDGEAQYVFFDCLLDYLAEHDGSNVSYNIERHVLGNLLDAAKWGSDLSII